MRTCFLFLALVSTGLARPNHPVPVTTAAPCPSPAVIGAPVNGLTQQQLMSFTVGKAQFEVVETPADGLGPLFNAQSCFACHTQPATASPATSGVIALPQVSTAGGASAFTETRAARLNADGSFNPLANEDGTLFKLSSLTPASQEIVPADATIVAHRKTTPLFGSGLIEAIPDAEIIANVHNPAVDGVTGKAAVLNDSVTTTIAMMGLAPRNLVGRFGWKCQESTLLAFAADAYLNEMGITNRFFTTDLAPDGNQSLLIAAEPMGFSLATPTTPTTQLTPTTLQDLPENPALPENPVTNLDDIDQFSNFMRMLAPPPTVPLTAQAQQGKQLFTQINCVACHKPQMQTGSSKVAALSFKNVPLYSDLLLHDVGTGDGIVQASANATQLRTPPLWGLRFRSPFLHDGSAETIQAAIERHGNEAQIIEQRFDALSKSQQNALVAFLNSI